jgi:cell division protease FtsH
MVVHWGMSEKFGPVAFRTDETHPFLGRDISDAREYSERTAQVIDEEVLRIVKEADAEATRILTEKRDLLDKLASTLETEEELDEARIIELIGPSPYQKTKRSDEE